MRHNFEYCIFIFMSRTDGTSIMIYKNLEEKTKRLKTNIKYVVEKALKEEIEKRRREKIKKLAEKINLINEKCYFRKIHKIS